MIIKLVIIIFKVMAHPNGVLEAEYVDGNWSDGMFNLENTFFFLYLFLGFFAVVFLISRTPLFLSFF